MAKQSMRSVPITMFGRLLALVVYMSMFIPSTSAVLTQSFCSNRNTSPDQPAFWKWQSNGHCRDMCRPLYAFAIVQGLHCWCSDFAPSDQSSISNCNEDCPGYPDEKCGNTEQNRFGYLALDKSPSGTLGSPSPTAPTRTPPPQSKSTSSTSTFVPSFIVSLQTVTVPGGVAVSTITSLPSPAIPVSKSDSGSNNTGTIAGAVVGAVGGLAIIAGAVWFFLRRRRQDREEQGDERPDERTSPRRNTSTLSKTGLLRTEKDIAPVLPAITRTSDRNANDMIHPPERRHSNIRLYDQRLNPSLLMDLDNGSHTSIITIEDNRDYNRALHVRNPDPPEHGTS